MKEDNTTPDEAPTPLYKTKTSDGSLELGVDESDGTIKEVNGEAVTADEAVPAEDPQPQPISFTPPGLFIANFFEIYRAFKQAQGNTTAKLQNDQFLVAESAKYAHALLGVQLGLIGAR